MQLLIQDAVQLHKELSTTPGARSYLIDSAITSLEKYIDNQLKEIEPPKTKPSTTTDDEIPF